MSGLLSGHTVVLYLDKTYRDKTCGQDESEQNVTASYVSDMKNIGGQTYRLINVIGYETYQLLNISATKRIGRQNVSAAIDFKQFFTLKNSSGFFVK
jgi:hypothetical protein